MSSIARLAAVAWLAVTPPFQILTTHLPPPHRGQAYHGHLKAEGGKTPYTWSIAQGHLPAGLRLNSQSGVISGQIENDRSFSVLVEVRDSSQPPLEETRLLPASASAPLDLRWAQAPRVEGDKITGAVEVRNDSGRTVQLTVIAVAVNEHNKAFSLRYAHEKLNAKQSTDALPFAVFVPPGQYTVNVDAVAAVSKDVIYRQRLEVPGLTVPGS